MHGVLLCYDVSDKESVKNLVTWNNECNKNIHRHFEKVMVGIRNRYNMNAVYKCHKDYIEMIAKQCQIKKIIETSVTKNINIDKPFLYLVEKLMQNIEKYPFSS